MKGGRRGPGGPEDGIGPPFHSTSIPHRLSEKSCHLACYLASERSRPTVPCAIPGSPAASAMGSRPDQVALAVGTGSAGLGLTFATTRCACICRTHPAAASSTNCCLRLRPLPPRRRRRRRRRRTPAAAAAAAAPAAPHMPFAHNVSHLRCQHSRHHVPSCAPSLLLLAGWRRSSWCTPRRRTGGSRCACTLC